MLIAVGQMIEMVAPSLFGHSAGCLEMSVDALAHADVMLHRGEKSIVVA